MELETEFEDADPMTFATRRERQNWKRSRRRLQQFIAWDSEGTNEIEPGKPQALSLFGASTGERIVKQRIRTPEALELILEVDRKYPHANHIAYAFNYDVDQILNSLSPYQFARLRQTHSVRYLCYRIEHYPKKWFMVTKYREVDGYPDWRQKLQTVKIEDMIGFFQSTFLKAIRSYIPAHPLMADLEVIEKGKKARSAFSYDKIDMIERYWSVEIKLMAALAEEFRERCHNAGLMINSWYGPGVMANYLAQHNKVRQHMKVSPPEVHEAAKRAYMGGRFELFKLGRIPGPVYSIDINSAYPAAITHVPSLTEGSWHHVTNPDIHELEEFGIYRIEVLQPFYHQRPGALFNRRPAGQIGFPHRTKGWYWTPEAREAVEYYATDRPPDISERKLSLYSEMLRTQRVAFGYPADPPMSEAWLAVRATLPQPYFRITEGWVYRDWTTRPYAFIRDMYEKRRVMAEDDGARIALKLGMNSVYGKTAQRKGWNRPGRKPGAPVWHQLEWAGYITSWTRAKLFSAMRLMGDSIIAVETDGIYTTTDPATIGIEHSTELGGWKIEQFKQMLYLQNGMYLYEKQDGSWRHKFRGFDVDSFTLDSVSQFLRSIRSPARHTREEHYDNRPVPQFTVGDPNDELFGPDGKFRHYPGNEWPKLSGHTTRFMNYAQALHMKKLDMRTIHRRWNTAPRKLDIESPAGKRRHLGTPGDCDGCHFNLSPWNYPHSLSIGGSWQGPIREEMESYPHDIPWDEELPDDVETFEEVIAWRIEQRLREYQ